MIYQGKFRTVYSNELYTVNLITNNDSSTITEITLGTPPLTTSIEPTEENIFKPVKYSSATVKMINDDYHFDLYASAAQQNKVEVLNENGEITWVGYITPNLYSQGYENEVEEIEIECIDALATLQYYEFEPIGQSKDIVSFVDLISHLLSKCNAYTKYYVTDNTQPKLLDNRAASLIEHIYISEQDFFDEDNQAMTFQEVLEEVCKYLNVTCVADGDKVYFLDYTAIKNDINTYYQYTIGNATGTLVTLSSSKSISGSDYMENGGVISLGNTYNKVTVKDSLYSFEPVIPELFSDSLIQYIKQDSSGNWQYYDEFTIDSAQADGTYKTFWKFYKHPQYKTYYYDKTTMDKVTPPTVTYQTLQATVGATIIRHYNKKMENDSDLINSIDWNDYICLHCHNKADGYLRPMVELDINNMPPSIISNESYFIINGSYTIYDIANEIIPYDGYSRNDDDFNPDYLHLKCSIECNNKFWDGQIWQDEFTAFDLPFDTMNQTDHFIGKEFKVKNTIDYTMNIDGSGYAVRVPTYWLELATTTARPSIVIYQPHNVDNGYPTHSAFIKDFDIKVVVPNKSENKPDVVNDTTDTEYYNLVDESYVNELDAITFKICTWDNKCNNYSCVMLSDSLYGLSEFLDKTHNKATNQDLRQEEHCIYNLVTQYKNPAVVLEINLRNDNIKPYTIFTDKWLPNRKFILDSNTIDWEYEKNTIKIIEKK